MSIGPSEAVLCGGVIRPLSCGSWVFIAHGLRWISMEIDGSEPEHVLCKRWRVEQMELTREQLSALTGFSASMIKDYERPGKVIDANARRRYRLACAAVEFGIDEGWEDRTLTLMRPVMIRTMRGD